MGTADLHGVFPTFRRIEVCEPKSSHQEQLVNGTRNSSSPKSNAQRSTYSQELNVVVRWPPLHLTSSVARSNMAFCTVCGHQQRRPRYLASRDRSSNDTDGVADALRRQVLETTRRVVVIIQEEVKSSVKCKPIGPRGSTQGSMPSWEIRDLAGLRPRPNAIIVRSSLLSVFVS